MLEDRLHRQLTYDLLPSMLGRDPGVGGGPWAGLARQRWPHALPHAPACAPAAADSAQDLAAELVHYGFVHEVCGPHGLGREGGG